MSSIHRRTAVAALAMGATSLLAPLCAQAQSQRPLTIVLTVPPGTSSDTLSRLLAEHLRSKLSRPVVVESKPGAGGLVAYRHLRSFDADGSYLMMAPNSSVSLLPLFVEQPTFVIEKDLQAVVECATAPSTFTVNATSPYKTLQEYFEGVRKDARTGSIGVPSPSSTAALLIHQLSKKLQLPLQAVPYRGGAPLLADLLGNQIPASASILPDYLESHRAGKLRVLAVTSDKRSALAPDIPTMQEAGFPGYHATTSFGLYAKAGIAPDVAQSYAQIVTAALRTPQIVEVLHKMGLEPAGGTPDEFQLKVIADRDRWAPVIRETGIKMDV